MNKEKLYWIELYAFDKDKKGTIEFKNLDRNQNAAQGKAFGGYISVELIQPTPEQKSE